MASKFALSIGGTMFQVSAVEAGKIMDVLCDAAQLDSTYGDGFPGSSHREASWPSEVSLRPIKGEIVSRKRWDDYRAAADAARAAAKEAAES